MYETLVLSRLCLAFFATMAGTGLAAWGFTRLFRRWRHAVNGSVWLLFSLWQHIRLYHSDYSYRLAGHMVVFLLPNIILGLPFHVAWDGDWDPAADQWDGRPEPIPRWRRVAGCTYAAICCGLLLLWLEGEQRRSTVTRLYWYPLQDPLGDTMLWVGILGLCCAGIALYELYQLYQERKTMKRLEQDRQAR
jgi:hypothetical protein